MAAASDRADRILSRTLILAGGFAGTVLRVILGDPFGSLEGILLVNFAGSFAMGALMYESLYTGRVGRHARMFFGTGFLGAFTTFSAIAVSALMLPVAAAAACLALMIGGGLFAVFLGRALVTPRGAR